MMERINYFALFGVIIFNLVLFSGFAITLVSLLFSLWIIVVSFVLSPILLLIVNQIGLQEYDIMQTILSCVVLIIGVGLAPLAMKATRYLVTFFIKYYDYNKKVIFANS